MNQPNQKQDPPYVQMILGIVFCSLSLLFVYEVIPLENPPRFRWFFLKMNEWFGRWWAVGLCLLVGLTLLLTGLVRLRRPRN